jgi:hypothetical protein
MDEKDEARIEAAIRQMLQDPVMVREVAKLRDRGMSEVYVQNWLRQMAMLNIKK